MDEEKRTFLLTIDEINIIIESLGNMPYVRVVVLIQNLKEQFDQQIDKKNRADD